MKNAFVVSVHVIVAAVITGEAHLMAPPRPLFVELVTCR